MSDNIRLDRLLSNLGYGSRKDAAGWVKRGVVTLGGIPVKHADQSIALADVKRGAVLFDGEPLDPPMPLTIMLNKPLGYICSHAEKGLLIYDLLPARWQERKPALSCAGRLDKESTGQVIITDDGELLHRIIHPKSHAEKHYTVTLQHPLRGNEAELFATGTFLMNEDVKPLKPAIWKADGTHSGRMILQEGRFHQIRRMFETIGNNVITLNRYRTGGLELGDLPVGEYRVLGEDEVARIFG